MSSISQDSRAVIALDIGTSSVRALAFSPSGHKIGEAAQIPYEQTVSGDGGVEVDADFLLQLCEKTLDALLPTLETEVAAIGISCFWHSLLAVDEAGNARTPVLSWADNRSAAWVEILKKTLDETAFHARLGTVFHTSYWPAKLLFLRDTAPQLFEQNLRWMGFGEWLRLKWCGNPRMSLAMASGTGIFDQNALEFDEEMLSHLPIKRENLPQLCDLDDGATLKSEFQNRWPKLRNAPIFPAIGDGACSNIGSGCTDEKRIGLNAGTSGAMRVVLRDFSGAPPRGLWRYRVDKNRSIVGGALSNVGNLLVWARETFQIPANWGEEIEKIAPDSHGLTVLPFLAGERAPIWDGDARFVLSGANLGTTPTHILRAVAEAGALRFAAIGNLLLQLAPNAQIVFSGGVLENVPAWQPIVCDALGAPLVGSREHEASARGAALLAWEKLGVALPEDFERGETLEPNAENHAIYERALERQNALYERLK